MNNETKETLTKVAEYAKQDKERLKKRMAGTCAIALILLIFCTILEFSNGFGGFMTGKIVGYIRDLTIGASSAILFLNILFLTGKMDAVQTWKKEHFHKN